MKTLFEQALSLIESGRDFVLATILSGQGSAPRGTGTQMLILADSIVETLGGGAMEAQAITLARESVLINHCPQTHTFDLRPEGKEAVCGGSVTVLLLYVAPTEDNRAVFDATCQAEADGSTAWLLQFWNNAEGHLCLFSRGELYGDFPGENPGAFATDPEKAMLHGLDGFFSHSLSICPTPRILLFGGGHVSLEIARLALTLGFRVTVLDDRAEFADKERFPGCETMVVPDFTRLPALPVGENTYILILTRGHQYDREVLAWALTRPARYIGMMGSRTKRDSVYRSLMEEGVTPEALSRVHCPIGLSIGAQTPAEIAVSVMAEVIQVRRTVQNI